MNVNLESTTVTGMQNASILSEIIHASVRVHSLVTDSHVKINALSQFYYYLISFISGERTPRIDVTLKHGTKLMRDCALTNNYYEYDTIST